MPKNIKEQLNLVPQIISEIYLAETNKITLNLNPGKNTNYPHAILHTIQYLYNNDSQIVLIQNA